MRDLKWETSNEMLLSTNPWFLQTLMKDNLYISVDDDDYNVICLSKHLISLANAILYNPINSNQSPRYLSK